MFNWDSIDPLIHAALKEDIGTGDVTTRLLVPEEAQGEMVFRTRQPLVVSGLQISARVFEKLGLEGNINFRHKDGQAVGEGERLLTLTGKAATLLTGERVALNFLQRMCGVATLTNLFVKQVEGTRAKILDTRKTLPAYRELDKYAAKCGGGVNHRMGLFDAIMIKDNHLQMLGGIKQAVAKARQQSMLPLIVECDTLEQVRDALAARPNRILLDNMSPSVLRRAVKMAEGSGIKLEASGGVNLKTVQKIARTGVDFISVGAITHSAPAADISAELELKAN